jgi:hypothetical protein
LPFKFFLSDTEEWISKAKKILDRFNLHTYESDYLEKACAIFQRSQLGIWQKNKRNHDLIDWQEKDTTEKANVLGHLHYLKIYKDGKPMPPPIYSNTPEMLATWVKILDSNGTVK